MIRFINITLLCVVALPVQSCEKNPVLPASTYTCSLSEPDLSADHPKADTYTDMLEAYQKTGVVGATLLIEDANGMWMGAAGKADIASDIVVQVCHPFAIASISKVFTSAAVYRYVDKGMLALSDPISKWLSEDIVEKVSNADQATIENLLAHTSGIADYYTLSLELDRINKEYNEWTKEEVLTYTYGLPATNAVNETYYYSNTNFLLLSIILENVSGLSFEQVYQQEVFGPAGLVSGYYSESNPVPDNTVKGYVDLYDNGQFVESQFLYQDEIGIGGDGGVIINTPDLAKFFKQLWAGDLISETSRQTMAEWFALPQDWIWDDLGQDENGIGIERFNTEYGSAIGHTGGVDGFGTFAFYFPETGYSMVLLMNTAGSDADVVAFIQEVLQTMF